MVVPQLFTQISAAISKKDLKSVAKLLKTAEKIYGNHPYFFFQKGMYERLKGSDLGEVVRPLWEKVADELKDDPDFLYLYGTLLVELEQFATAMGVFGALIKINPKHIDGLIAISSIFEKTGNPISATNTCKMVLKLSPNNTRAYSGMGNGFMESGYQEESIESYKKALECNNKNNVAADNYLFSTNYMDMNKKEIFSIYQQLRIHWEDEVLPPRSPFPKTNKIKIGFVSADFCAHSVSFFISAIFQNYDKSKFEIHIFANVRRFDNVSQKFKDWTDKWHDITRVNYPEVGKLIKQEKISVLIDLSGHTASNRLRVFGLRSAPLQITYCGYPNTTGLKSIDYRISDVVCEPDDAQDFHSEKLYKLDGCFLCYSPYAGIPECEFIPIENDRPIIFASFNNVSKMTKRTMKIWSKAVNAVPNAKFVIKHRYLNDPKLRELMLTRFAECGLSADKIIIFDFDFDDVSHLKQYKKIDIAFDSFPYNGTTTTCEALYMGVPVITILGDRHASRVSASLLTAVGLPEFIAKDEDDFVRIAKDLAQDTKKLTEIRQNLRSRMDNSILCDKKSFVNKWQNAILDMINEVKKEEFSDT
jgi:predicted O-linked N-acetylglucosamine transferase (SPINDLY family)